MFSVLWSTLLLFCKWNISVTMTLQQKRLHWYIFMHVYISQIAYVTWITRIAVFYFIKDIHYKQESGLVRQNSGLKKWTFQ